MCRLKWRRIVSRKRLTISNASRSRSRSMIESSAGRTRLLDLASASCPLSHSVMSQRKACVNSRAKCLLSAHDRKNSAFLQIERVASISRVDQIVEQPNRRRKRIRRPREMRQLQPLTAHRLDQLSFGLPQQLGIARDRL